MRRQQTETYDARVGDRWLAVQLFEGQDGDPVLLLPGGHGGDLAGQILDAIREDLLGGCVLRGEE